MKRILFIVFCILSSSLSIEANDCEVAARKVHLTGFLTKPTDAKSAVPGNEPVVVTDYDHFLYVKFRQNLGLVNITITNEQGYCVYQQSVNTASVSYHIIPTGSYHPGTYTITISNSVGSLTGEFVRQ